MNADDCRKRADECLAAAQYASDRDAQRTWRQLADMWLLWSEQLQRFSASKVGAAADNELQNGARGETVTESASAPATADNRKVAEIADRLRSRLSLAK
jgi:hypothetical protein